MKEAEVTSYHAVSWREPIVYQLSNKGRRGHAVPQTDSEIRRVVGDVSSKIPSSMRRRVPPNLPELSEPQVVRHFIRLSQETFGCDSGFHNHGTCTMKYNPKVNEALARSQKISGLHPLQQEETVQGILQIMYEFQAWLSELSGMSEFSLQPRGGAQATFANARMIRAYHKLNGELEQRKEIITTVLSHPCNAGSPAAAGFKVITLYPDEKTGYPDIEAFKAVLSKRTAGLMMTDPYDTGIFDSNIEEYIRLVHEVGAVVAIDQANANSMLGRFKIGDLGVDLCHFNLHKSFSTPHSSAGPGSAAVGASDEFAKFLPVPVVGFDEERYFLDYDRANSIGKLAEFYGVIPNIVRAYSWVLAIGRDGLEEASEGAIINNNYLIKKLQNVRGVTLPWSKTHPFRLQEARFSMGKLKEETGVGVDDVNRRIVDYGLQDMETSHEPWIVPEPFTPEPVETTPREDLDLFVSVLSRISREAYTKPEIVKSAPHNATIAKIDPVPSSDPKRWAMTWSAYLRKKTRTRR